MTTANIECILCSGSVWYTIHLLCALHNDTRKYAFQMEKLRQG